ncbi:helix-turn-helix domain-containing protein [Bordetella bronchiseptica]|uniref:helix-turn-helix domain-containing protein n=1 Tax=Bordetella bronchiseptica TaxID=518 RepID=UPI00052899F8|nr:helix-turn-helix domain-containing protein [Bordetella bronchiseptica]
MARPSKYKPEFAVQAKKLAALGATDMEVAEFFGVTDRTIYRWKAEFKPFCQASKAGKSTADDRVERALYQRAVGYSYHTEKLFQHDGSVVRAKISTHVPPDVAASFIWLKNRRPELWRDKPDPTNDDNAPPPVKVVIEVVNASVPDADA